MRKDKDKENDINVDLPVVLGNNMEEKLSKKFKIKFNRKKLIPKRRRK